MRRIPRLIMWQFGLLAGRLLFGDVVTLKDGRQISGLVESGDIRKLHVKVADHSETIDIDQVQVIQFGASLTAVPAEPAPRKAAGLAPAAPEPAPAKPSSLILKDGTHVSGRWWSIDATDVHFLVNNQLEHYPRHDVLGVTFGNATLPAPPDSVRSAQTPATPAPTAHAPATPRAPSDVPPAPPTLTKPSSAAPRSTPSRIVSQPDEIGMVYFWNGTGLVPLEVNRAAPHKSGSAEYWEMAGPQSRVRVNEVDRLVFIVSLPEGVDPASYSLFSLVTVNGSRRTRVQTGRGAGLVTWPVDIQINNRSSLIVYALTVRDLPAGEYSFSPSNTNDGYCFGVDPNTPGK